MYGEFGSRDAHKALIRACARDFSTESTLHSRCESRAFGLLSLLQWCPAEGSVSCRSGVVTKNPFRILSVTDRSWHLAPPVATILIGARRSSSGPRSPIRLALRARVHGRSWVPSCVPTNAPLGFAPLRWAQAGWGVHVHQRS